MFFLGFFLGNGSQSHKSFSNWSILCQLILPNKQKLVRKLSFWKICNFFHHLVGHALFFYYWKTDSINLLLTYRKSGYYGTNFIFFLHCLYIFLQYTRFLCKKTQIFGFQILRVIWDNSVFGRIKRFWWRIFNLLYLPIIFKKYISIWDH